MKMIAKKISIATALSLVLLSACSKEEDPTPNPQPTAPTITINEPSKSMYEVGDTAWVNIVITDAEELHEAEAWFVKRPQNDTLWEIHRHSHDKTITFNSYYIIEDMADEQMVDLEVMAENEAGLTGTAKHSFEVHDH